MSGRRHQVGFSLLEIIIVLAIAGLLMTLIPPAFDGLVQSQSLKQQASRLVSELRLTRQQSVSLQQIQALNFDLGNSVIRNIDKQLVMSLNPETRIKLQAAASTLEDGHIAAIRFYPDGSSSGGQIRLADERQAYDISVSWITGQVRVEPASAL